MSWLQTRNRPIQPVQKSLINPVVKLAWGLAKKHCGGDKVTPILREFLLDAIVLAAMGTVADVPRRLDVSGAVRAQVRGNPATTEARLTDTGDPLRLLLRAPAVLASAFTILRTGALELAASSRNV